MAKKNNPGCNCCDELCLCEDEEISTWRVNLTGVLDDTCITCSELNGDHDVDTATGTACKTTTTVSECGTTVTLTVELIDVDASNFKFRLTVNFADTNKNAILESANVLKTTPCCSLDQVALSFVSQDSGINCDFSLASGTVTALCDLLVGETCCDFWERNPGSSPSQLWVFIQFSLEVMLFTRTAPGCWEWSGNLTLNVFDPLCFPFAVELTQMSFKCDGTGTVTLGTPNDGCATRSLNLTPGTPASPPGNCACPDSGIWNSFSFVLDDCDSCGGPPFQDVTVLMVAYCANAPEPASSTGKVITPKLGVGIETFASTGTNIPDPEVAVGAEGSAVTVTGTGIDAEAGVGIEIGPISVTVSCDILTESCTSTCDYECQAGGGAWVLNLDDCEPGCECDDSSVPPGTDCTELGGGGPYEEGDIFTTQCKTTP